LILKVPSKTLGDLEKSVKIFSHSKTLLIGCKNPKKNAKSLKAKKKLF